MAEIDWTAEEAKEREIARMIADGGLGYGFRSETYQNALNRAAACRRLAHPPSEDS